MRVQLTRRCARAHDDRGVVSVVVAVLAVALLALGAFTIDFGMAYSQRAALSTGADSAALKVVRQAYFTELATPMPCASYVSYDENLDPDDPGKSTNVALAALNANAPYGTSLAPKDLNPESVPRGVNGGPLTVLSCDPSKRVLQATVKIERSIPVGLGGIVGVHQLNVNRVAQAALGVANSITGVRPFGVCTYQAQQIVKDAAAAKAAGAAYPAEVISPDKIWKDTDGNDESCEASGSGNGNGKGKGNGKGSGSGSSSTGAGNWGWLNLGQNNGSTSLGYVIEHGASDPLTVTGTPPSLEVDGTPGNKGNSENVSSAWQAIMDKTVVLPVYDSFSGNGNVTFNVIGFLTVQICGYDKRDVKGTCDDPSVAMTGTDIEVRFADYTPLGSISQVCGIGESCASNTYVTKLVE